MEQQQYGNPLLEDAQVGVLAGQGQQLSNAAKEQEYIMEEKEKSLAEAQLECDKTLNNQYHKLRQDVLTFVKGKREWIECPAEKRILTDEGVNKIMQILEGYVNKETLLSNFDKDQINVRMLKFCKALNANLFMKYEVYFRLPNIQECETILKQQINDKIETKKMSLRLRGEEINEDKIKKEILEQYGSSFEDEIKTIRLNKLRENIREYEIIFTQMEAIVDAIHNRAFRGEERGSIRRHQNIQQVIGTSPSQVQAPKNNWYKWGG